MSKKKKHPDCFPPNDEGTKSVLERIEEDLRKEGYEVEPGSATLPYYDKYCEAAGSGVTPPMNFASRNEGIIKAALRDSLPTPDTKTDHPDIASISIAPKQKRSNHGEGYFDIIGYKVTFTSRSPESDESSHTETFQSHDNAIHQAVWWSFKNDDAEITEYGREWGKVERKFRSSDLDKDDPILNKVIRGTPPNRD